MSPSVGIVDWLYCRLLKLAKSHRALLQDHYGSPEETRHGTRSVAYELLLLHDPESRYVATAEECMLAAIRWGDNEALCFRRAEDYTGERHA